MKPAALIISILMGFLTSQPLLVHCQKERAAAKEMSGCCGGKTCGKKDTQKEENKPCTDASACNPFAGCSQCQYVHTATNSLPGRIAVIAIKKIGLHTEPVHPGFTGDSWNPPRALLV